jgi:predicted NAD/FAD-binding protein
MGAAIWSCPTGTFGRFPIRFIIEFYHNHGLLRLRRRPTWRVVEGGSRRYVQALIRGFRDRIRLNSPVVRVGRFHDRVCVHARGKAAESFDHVIFACHSDQALRILGEQATEAEREVLSAFPYGRNVALLHSDVSVLPRRRKAWASWNYRVGTDASSPPTVTYNMNLLQGIRSRHTYCVTLNDESQVTPSQILRRIEYHHPIFTTQRAAAQARHVELLGPNRTSFCGAYWGNGFHEDGVNSALAVVDTLRGPAKPKERRGRHYDTASRVKVGTTSAVGRLS